MRKINLQDINSYVDILILLICEAFIFFYIDPRLLLLKTITAGGDTASHYYTCVFLKDILLPKYKIMGWMNANYAGFPVFYHYFPLPFVLVALLSYIIPMQISFKIITILGTILLPISVYIAFRLSKLPKPIPILAAVSCLAFLFNEKNSMWGGNIPSTLAGEFSFSLSLTIFCLLLGVFYKGINERKFLFLNAVLIALMVLGHGYTFVMFCLIICVFLIGRNWIYRVFYVGLSICLGVFFIGFWFIPFIGNLPWVTPYRLKWIFMSPYEIFPPILIPFFILGVAGIIVGIRHGFVHVLGFLFVTSVVGYFFSYDFGLADIRFLTFAQLSLTLCSPLVFLLLRKTKTLSTILTTAFIIGSFLWISSNTNYIKNWAKWNYSGFESKMAWGQAEHIFHFLRDNGQGRVAYENSGLYDRFGTMRVFESLKLFSGRDTLEGLYMQSSITAPFVFYIQSEISKTPSGPFPDYKITSVDIETASKHLEMFAVTQIIAISSEVKRLLKTSKDYTFQERFGDIEIFQVKNSSPNIVVPALYKPVAYTKDTWKREFYEWFRNPQYLDVPLVKIYDPKDIQKFELRTDDIKAIPIHRLDLLETNIIEDVSDEKIEFRTNLIGHPHIIRMSYHPNWKVTGAEKIYHIAPSFMLVFPSEPVVKLTFSNGCYDHLGILSTLIGICIALFFRNLIYNKLKMININIKISFPKFKLNMCWIIVLFCSLLFAFTFSYITITIHRNFGFSAYDFGIHIQALWKIVNYKGLYNTIRGLNIFGDHLWFILYLIAPIYKLFQAPETLLIIQASIAGLGGIAVFLISRLFFDRWYYALLPSVVFLLNPSLHNALLESFHPEILGISFTLFSIHFLLKKSYLAFWLFVTLGLSCKEDYSIAYFFYGIYVAIKHSRVHGIILSVISLIYFIVSMLLILPFFNNVGFFRFEHGYWFSGLKSNLYNPSFYINRLFSFNSLKYLLILLLPLSFFPLLRPLEFGLALPAIVINLLSGSPYLISGKYHYEYNILPFLILAFVFAFKRLTSLNRVFNFASTFVVFIFVLLGFLLHSNVLERYLVNYLKSKIDETKLSKVEALKLIPPNATVSASHLLVNHLAQREEIYMFPNPFKRYYFGISDSDSYNPKLVDYIIVSKSDFQGEPVQILTEILNEGYYRVTYNKHNILVAQKSIRDIYDIQEEEPPNLLINGSFEKVFLSDFSDWKLYSFKRPALRISTDQEIKMDGKHSLKVEHVELNHTSLSQLVYLRADQQYVLNGWVRAKRVRTEKSHGIQIRVEGPVSIIEKRFESLLGDTDWNEQRITFAVHGKRDDYVPVRVECSFGYFGDCAVGTAWFDKIVLKKVEDE